MGTSEFKDPKPEILEFIEKHKGELLLNSHEVVKLIGFDEDEDDYYYVLHSLINGKYLESCVGALYPLKGVLPNKEYDCLVNIFNINIGFKLQKQKIEYLTKSLENLKKQGLSVGYVLLDHLIGTVDSTVFDTYEDAERVLKGYKDINVRIVPIIDYEGED
jgi:hypothetical protein